jgi:nitrate reductase gamma subunit
MTIFDAPAVKPSKPSWWSGLGFHWQLLSVLCVAVAIGAGSVPYGFHDAHQCAVDYPHDGQCGLVVMMDVVFGLVGGVAVLVIGGFIVLYQRAAKDRERTLDERQN